MFVGFFLRWILGTIAVMSPSWIFLKNQRRLSGKELAQAYPSKGWIRWSSPVLFFMAFFALFLLMFALIETSAAEPSIEIFLLSLVVLVGLGIYSGFFEIVTGVSPQMRRFSRPRYIYCSEVSIAGYVRVFVGFFILFASCIILWLAA